MNGFSQNRPSRSLTLHTVKPLNTCWKHISSWSQYVPVYNVIWTYYILYIKYLSTIAEESSGRTSLGVHFFLIRTMVPWRNCLLLDSKARIQWCLRQLAKSIGIWLIFKRILRYFAVIVFILKYTYFKKGSVRNGERRVTNGEFVSQNEWAHSGSISSFVYFMIYSFFMPLLKKWGATTVDNIYETT